MPLETQPRDPFSAGIFTASPQEISVDILLEKYAKDGEQSIDDIYQRVAKGLASVEKPERRAHFEQVFLANMHAGAIGAGRIMSAAGTDIQSTLINCFVQPVGDCIQGEDDDGFPGIYEALKQAAETMRRGAVLGMTFLACDHEALVSKGQLHWHRVPAVISMSLINLAPLSKVLARDGAHRWVS